MYLQKCAQYAGGEYVGADVDGNLYNSVVVFMINGLKTYFPFSCESKLEKKN